MRPATSPRAIRRCADSSMYRCTVSVGMASPCWKVRRMPARARRVAERPSILRSPRTISPSYPGMNPVTASTSVDLPAPLGPMSACTVPGATSRSTPSSAVTLP